MRATSSNAVFQHLRSSSRVSAVVFQHLCFSMFHFCVAASVFASNSRVSATTFSAFVIQHFVFQYLRFTFVLQHLFSHLCCSICVCFQQSCFSNYVFSICDSAFVFQYLRFTFVLQHLFSHLCCSICVCFQHSIAINDNLDHLRHSSVIAINDNLNHMRHFCCSHISNKRTCM